VDNTLSFTSIPPGQVLDTPQGRRQRYWHDFFDYSGLHSDTYPGPHSVVEGSPRTEEYQVEYLDMNHRVFDRIEAVVGEQVWNFADFATTSGIMRVGGNKKGRVHPDRQPKAAAHALRRRWRTDL